MDGRRLLRILPDDDEDRGYGNPQEGGYENGNNMHGGEFAIPRVGLVRQTAIHPGDIEDYEFVVPRVGLHRQTAIHPDQIDGGLYRIYGGNPWGLRRQNAIRHREVGDGIIGMGGYRDIPQVGGVGRGFGECGVCQENSLMNPGIPMVTGPCNHTYHVECIRNWLETNNICPVCLRGLRRDELGFGGRSIRRKRSKKRRRSIK